MIEIETGMIEAQPAKVAFRKVVVDGHSVNWDQGLGGIHCYAPKFDERNMTAADFEKFAEIFLGIAATMKGEPHEPAQESTDADNIY